MRGDLLDLILIGLVIAFGISGYRQGFIIGAMSFVGFVGGAVLGVFIAPPIAKAVVDGDTPQALLAIVIVFLAATIGQFASSTIGAVVRSHVTWEPAKVADAVGGTFASALSVLVIAWLIGSLIVSTAFTPLVDQVKNSMLLTTVDDSIPQTARNWQQPFKKFVDRSEFPPVFDAIGAGQLVDVPPPARSILQGAKLGRAQRAIVKVQGNAESCNKLIEGTGFVYAKDRIMTNAHVVAGVTRDLQVLAYDNKRHPATVVRYNPQRDIAILLRARAGPAAALLRRHRGEGRQRHRRRLPQGPGLHGGAGPHPQPARRRGPRHLPQPERHPEGLRDPRQGAGPATPAARC